MSKNSIDSKHDSSDLSMSLLNRNNSTVSTTTSAPETTSTTTTISSPTTTTKIPTTTNTNTTTTNSSDSCSPLNNNNNSNDMVNDHMLQQQQQQSNSKKSSISESTSFLNVNNIKAHSENYCFVKAKKLERKYLKNSSNNSSTSNSNKNAISDNSAHPSDKYLNLYLDEKQQQLETGGAAGGGSATTTTTSNQPSKNVIKSYPLFRSKDPPRNSDAGKFNYSFNSLGKRSRSSAASASSAGSCSFCRQDSIESHNGGNAAGIGEYSRQHSAPSDTRPLSLTSSTSTTTACTINNTPGIINYNNCYNSTTTTTTTTAPATSTPTTSTTRLNSLKPASCLCFHTNSLKRKRLPSSTNRLSGGGGGGRYTLYLIFKFYKNFS